MNCEAFGVRQFARNLICISIVINQQIMIIDGGLPQALEQGLQFLNEEYPPSKMTSLPEIDPAFMRLPDTAELWVLNAQEA